MNYTITEIEKRLTYQQVQALAEDTMIIKEHEIFFVNLGDYFGFSALVWKNGKHIYFANLYKLHYSSAKNHEEMKQRYIISLNRKLFTDAEMMEDVTSYDEYQRKQYYLRNYYIMRFDYLSMFAIGKEQQAKLEKRQKDYPYANNISSCYVKDKDIIDTQRKYLYILKTSLQKLIKSEDTFREMVQRELENHEACITCSYTEALDALGLSYDALTMKQKKIVKEELRKQINKYCHW